ncbi:hypothetical protein CIPAW_03G133100 [Carya illinoinensis]|uniref:Uncharacterized protein n=1 Tax=Carya illinoinensis TaxID=32201 RepID=A0A8T1R0F3_CARIL|nr:hypothetical protein CIPAW_03G133100 [Carya illinoinensis]
MPWLSAPYSQNLESSVDVNDKVGGRDNKASSISSSQEDQAQKQKHEQQHAESHVQSKHDQPRTEAPTVLRSPSKQGAADSRDNEIISRRTTEHPVHKEADMPKDHQALLRQKENGGVTNINPDPPVNNNPITVLNINVYVDQPKSVDKNDIAIKKNKAPDPKPQNGIVSSKPPSGD